MRPISKLQGRLQSFAWDRAERYFLSGFGVVIFLSIILVGFVQLRRNLLPYKIILTAGEKTGESYILSDAIAKVAQKHTNIRIDVCQRCN